MGRMVQRDGAFAAIAMVGNPLHRVARIIGARLPAGYDDPESLGLVEWIDDLSPLQVRRLRAYLWRYGVAFLDVPICLAVQAPLLPTLRTWRAMAERYPDLGNCGLAFAAFARIWRAWLRFRGRTYRIASRVRP